MASQAENYRSALHDFRAARQQVALQEVLARLTGRSTQLLSYEEVAEKLGLTSRSDRGIRQIPIRAIVGSVGRYTDFTRTFLPRQERDRERWARVKAATIEGQGSGMPPIDVYQVGGVYFVLDGNHRVSIARQAGMDFIDANVIELQTSVPLTPELQPDELIVKAEYADFLAQTHLAELRPNVLLELTAPGQYRKLREQVEVQRYQLAQEHGGPVNLEEAAGSWYDQVYLPVMTAIQERGLLRWFPGRTEADLYLWVSEHREALEQELGWKISPEAAAADLAVSRSGRAGSREKATGSWRETHLVDRYVDHLFRDILVPLSGEEGGWVALEQAVKVAAREDAQVHGLHLLPPGSPPEEEKLAVLKFRFDRTCAAGGVRGQLRFEEGEVAAQIVERARLTDLVVLNFLHPPDAGLSSLSSGLRSIISRCARPLLAVPCCQVSPLTSALLAFDGSPKSREALFVAAYLAEQWMTSLVVMAVADGRKVQASVLDYARSYLELHEIQAEFLLGEGPITVLHDTMDERGIDLLLMGGYNVSAVDEVLKGSAVNFMLREEHCPIFICR
jgi:nucleotide-binding universal stress UspA family protein